MKIASKVLVCLLVSSITFAAIPAIAQQRKRTARSAAEVKAENPTAQRVLPLRKVILYSNGVAYFERRGQVAGNSNIEMQFTPEEIDDVLKSLVILDRNSGHISAVSFDTAKPLNVALSEFAFSLNGSANEGTGMAKILDSFKGADVEVKEGQVGYTGKIVGVEKRQQMVADHQTETYWLTIISADGEARSFQLSQMSSVRLLDPALREEVGRYLSLVGTAHRKDNKTLTINARGEGTRELLVSYTVAAPVWKTTYRAVIDDKGHPYLQGWAIVDNMQGEDWQNVDLSLVSGMPVSFIENLKQPLYRSRPVVALSRGYEVAPQIHEADGFFTIVQPRNDMTEEVSVSGTGEVLTTQGAIIGDTLKRKELPKGSQNLSYDGINVRDNLLRSSAEGATQLQFTTTAIGELFQYNIAHPVTILKNQSALIPIVEAKVEGEAVSIFNEQSRLGNPLSGLRLKNTTGLTLDGGPITVIDGDSYAGEALIDRIKPDETRLVSYAVDLGVRISTKNGSAAESVSSVKVVNGVVQMTVKNVDTKTYTINNVSDKTKVLIIEHPRRANFKLLSTAEPNSLTDNYYRFRVELQPHSATDFVVKEEQPVSQTIEVSNFTRERVSLLLQEKYISPEMKQKLTQLIEQRTKIDEVNRQISSKEDAITTIVNDQARLRENINSLGKTSEEHKLLSRYISKLDETETSLEKLRTEVASLKETKDKMESEFGSLVANLGD